jgi:HEAT repeat protein
LQSESNHLVELVKYEYTRNARIERLMNPAKTFPIEQSYINLALVKVKEQHEKEKQLRNAQHGNAIMGAFEEIYGTKTAIDVKDIFHTCKNREKQVLVFGRAGIGKSTFCRYVAYQWATGSCWSQYELLALIPLRRLTINRYPPLPLGKTYHLIDLVKKEVFQYRLTEKDDKLLNKQFDVKNILWILDGYDEIVQNVPEHLQCLFEELLKTPHHILTSRPYLNTLSYDVQMEITGFTDENITEYMLQFFDQMKDELDNASIKRQNLLSFLRSNPSIWGVAHIPVNLELICSLWSNTDWSETKELTITTLYSMMTEWLFRRYLMAQNIQIQQIPNDEVEKRCQKELTFLESLAFNAMESNTIILRPALLKTALNEAQFSLQDQPDILNIGILKTFNKPGVGTQIEPNKDHYFVHLSFQEYFAARYLINTLNGSSSKKVVEFIKRQKYNQRFALVFTFASGLLSEKNVEACLHIFWETMQAEPLDLVGIRHMQLVITWIEETSDKSTVPRRIEMIERIATCIKYSFSADNKIIRAYLSQSLQRAPSVTCYPTIMNAFTNLLQSEDPQNKAEVLKFICRMKFSNPSTTLTSTVVAALQDESGDVRRYAREALESMGGKVATNEVISKLVSALGDERAYMRRDACKILGNMGETVASNELTSKLVSALGDENESVRVRACEALGKMGEKVATDDVIKKLTSALGDDSEDVRDKACKALGNMGEKAATNEVIRKLANALGDESRSVRGKACKALGNMGEKAATIEVISKLVSVLGDEREYMRRDACRILGNMGETTASNELTSKLVSALEDGSESVRVRACEALGKMDGKVATNEVISKLVSALGDDREDVRMYACEALGNMGAKAAANEVISKLVSVLGDGSESVRVRVCQALGKMGEKVATDDVIKKLASALEDTSKDVRKYACEVLGNIGGKAATNHVINKLAGALGDDRENVRRNACKALGNMIAKSATNEVISKLASAIGDASKDVRTYACKALGKMGEKAATNEVISKLVSALGDESEDVGRNACVALTKMGEKAATNEVITKFTTMINTGTYFISYEAADAVGKILSSPAVIAQLNPKIISDLCLCQYPLSSLKNISADQ